MPDPFKRIDRIFELVGSQRQGLTHSQIARASGIPKSTLSLLLGNMVEHGYLRLSQPGFLYVLGPRFLVIAGRFMNNQDIVSTGRPVLEHLVEELNETGFLAVKSELEVVYVARVNAEQRAMNASVRLGQSAPLYNSAAGKAILAFQADSKINHYLSSILSGQPDREAAVERFKAEMVNIREIGVAICREEFEEGITGFGAALFNLDGRTVGAMTIAVPSFRLDRQLEARILKRLFETTRQYSRQLGFDGQFKRDRRKQYFQKAG